MGSCIHMMRKLANFSGIQVSIVCYLLAMLATNLAFSSSRFGYCFSLVATYMYIESILLVSAYQALVLIFSLVLCSLIYIITLNILYIILPNTNLRFSTHKDVTEFELVQENRRCPLAFYLIHIYFCICFR
jgi:hypothetical protein